MKNDEVVGSGRNIRQEEVQTTETAAVMLR
jgi:hypothetical protein